MKRASSIAYPGTSLCASGIAEASSLEQLHGETPAKVMLKTAMGFGAAGKVHERQSDILHPTVDL